MATDPTHARLAAELESREAFDLAHEQGMAYLDGLYERTVFPTDRALDELAAFDEPLPVEPAAATNVIEMLARYGAPGTTTQLGGRYFGFVTGGATPAGLPAKNLATYWDQNSAIWVMSPFVGEVLRAQSETALNVLDETWPTRGDRRRATAIRLAIDLRTWQSLDSNGLGPAEASRLMASMVGCLEPEA